MPIHFSRSSGTRTLFSGSLIRTFLLFICLYLPAEAPARPVQQPSAAGPRELLIIDSKVPDQQVLKETARDGMEVFLLKADQPALQQITGLLSRFSDLDAVHLVTHGSMGTIELNDQVLNLENIYQNRDMLAAWGKALKEDGDFLLYGCNIAEGRVGKAYLTQLANITGADLAASEDLTGAAGKGGDWELEFKVGRIGSQTLQALQYPFTLQTPVVGTPYTFKYAEANGDGTYTTAEKFFLISAFNGANPAESLLSADQFGAFINETSKAPVTSYIEVKVKSGGSFMIETAAVGEIYAPADFYDIYAAGYVGTERVAITPKISSVGTFESKYTLDFSDFNGKQIDAFRVYYTTTSGTPQDAFNVESITLAGVSTEPPPPANTAPAATEVAINGTLTVGQILAGSYTYSDAEGDAESGTIFKWYRADNAAGLNKSAIASAIGATYTLQAADEGKYISFEVTPKDGSTAGSPVESARLGPVASILITDANISISGGSGTGGAFRIGDTVTTTWNNTASGDNNSNITTVSVDFSGFGGGAAVPASASGGTWTATHTIVAGTIDATNRNVSVTASNGSATKTTADGTNATVDNVAPVISDAHISIAGASGTGGTFKIGDVVTATWNNTAAGDNNSDQLSAVTFNFSQFGGGTAVSASNSSGTWTATYTITAGSIDAGNRNVAVSATDNAGNVSTVTDATNASVDNVAPVLTDAKIFFVNSGSGTSEAFIAGDDITVAWNNAASGDSNADVISAVTIDFSQFGGGSAIAATNTGDIWRATYTLAAGELSGSAGVSVTVTDNAGNSKTLAGSGSRVADNVIPEVQSVAVPADKTYQAGAELTFTVNFSEAVSIFGSPYLALNLNTGGAVQAGYIAGSGTNALTFTYVVTAGTLDPDGITLGSLVLNSGTIKDTRGNNANLTLNSVGSTAGVHVDGQLPTATVVVSPTALRAGETAVVTITFSEAVTGLSTADFTVENGTLSLLRTADAGATWTATLTPANGVTDASNTISLANSGVQDAAGNAGTGTTVSNNYEIDSRLASVTAVAVPAADTYVAGQDLDFIVTFEKNITVTTTGGVPSIGLTLSGAGGSVTAAYQSGSGTSSLVFRYTVADGNLDTDGPQPGAAISLNGGTLKDGAGNPVNLELNNVASSSGIVVDAVAPATPANLMAASGDTDVTLTWTANSESDMKSYKVYGGTTANPATLLQTITAPATTFTHSGLTNGTTYYYRISAGDQAGNISPVTADVTAVPKSAQTITFSALASATYADSDLDPGATSSSGLQVTYSSSNTSVATIVAGKIHITGVGQTDITASQAGNMAYLPATPVSRTLTVAPKPITLSLNATPAVSKVYEGTTEITLAAANYSLSGVVSGEEVTVSGTASFDTQSAGTGKTVTVNSFVLAGAQKDNYTLTTTTATTTGTITAKPITVTLNATPAISKIYDGTTGATLATGNYALNDVETGDEVTVTGTATYDTPGRGTGKTVTVGSFVLAGAQKDNYTLTTTTATTTGTITGKPITVTLNATPLISKVYDGTTGATLAAGNYTLNNVETGDEVTVSGTAAYDTKDAGTGKTITATGFVLAGAQKDNYTLTTTTASTTGTIAAKPITVSLNPTPVISRTYDGTTGATLAAGNYTLNDVEAGDEVAVAGTASYDTKAAAIGKTITVNSFVLAGAQKDNYSLTTTTASTTGTITAKPITVTLNATPAITRVYDGGTGATLAAGNYTLNDVETGDEVTVSGTAAYDTKNAGTGKTITVTGFVLAGAEKDNYSLTTATATTTGTITAKPITLALNAAPVISKTYDGTTGATLAPGNYTLSDVETGDEVTVSGTASYDTKATGTGKTVTVNTFVLAGAQKDNYTLTTTTATTTGTITAKPITVTLNATPAISKIYDGTTGATLATGNYALNDVETGDEVTVTGTATYDTPGRGTGKTVTVGSFVLAGAQKDNYTLTTTTATTTGTITGKPITVTLNASPKISRTYDGTTLASLVPANYSLSGVEGQDKVTISGTASYEDANAGTGKTITVDSFVLSGAEKDNYELTTVSAEVTGDILQKDVTASVSALPAITKEYDANITAQPAAANYVLTGVVGQDDLAVSGTASFESKDAGIGKTITVTGLGLTGSAKDNYKLSNTEAQTTGSITAKTLTVRAEDKTRFQGTENPGLTVTYDGFVSGEDASVLTVKPVVSTAAGTTSAIGEYPIVVNGAKANNYKFVYEPGVLKVVPGAPTSVALAAAVIFENQAAGTAAGTLSSASPDPGATFTYSLVAGEGDADNKLFAIEGNELRTAARLNYEQKSTYSIRIRSTTQHGFSLDEIFEIHVSDVNEAPTLGAVADQTICYTTAPMVLQLDGVSAGPERNQTYELSVLSDNPKLFEQLTIGNNGKLTYRVRSGSTGRAVVTVNIEDNGGTANGGVNTFSRTFTLSVNPLPVINIASDKGTSISKGETVQLTASGGTAYDWADAAGITGSRKMQTLTVRPSVTTTYKVQVTTATGCQAEEEITIEVRDDYQVVQGTNLVSPNGDGVNDRLIIRNIDMYPNNVVKIYDRAGRLLYSKNNYTDEWDGTFQGSPLAEGTYYYIVDFGERQLKGFITIVRD